MSLTPADALLAQQDWTRAAEDLDAHGNAILPALCCQVHTTTTIVTAAVS